MKHCKLICGFVFFVALQAKAQYSEIGVTAGFCSYIGDLQTRIQSETYKPGLGLSFTYNSSKRLFYRGMVTGGQFAGSDLNNNNYLTRLRNLSVRTDFYDISAQIGFNLFPYEVRAAKIATPYVYAGVGGLWFNPKTQLNGKWVDLQPLNTEGQTKSYSRIALMFPLGGGVRFALTQRFNIGFDAGVRFAFTDYLDDVSGLYPDIKAMYSNNQTAALLSYRTPELFPDQKLDNPIGQIRGDAYARDLYFYGGITLTYNLSKGYDLEFDRRYDSFKSKRKEKLPPAVEEKK